MESESTSACARSTSTASHFPREALLIHVDSTVEMALRLRERDDLKLAEQVGESSRALAGELRGAAASASLERVLCVSITRQHIGASFVLKGNAPATGWGVSSRADDWRLRRLSRFLATLLRLIDFLVGGMVTAEAMAESREERKSRLVERECCALRRFGSREHHNRAASPALP